MCDRWDFAHLDPEAETPARADSVCDQCLRVIWTGSLRRVAGVLICPSCRELNEERYAAMVAAEDRTDYEAKEAAREQAA